MRMLCDSARPKRPWQLEYPDYKVPNSTFHFLHSRPTLCSIGIARKADPHSPSVFYRGHSKPDVYHLLPNAVIKAQIADAFESGMVGDSDSESDWDD